MGNNLFKIFSNMSHSELANYYVDVCAYRDAEAIECQKVICRIIVDRFIEKYADKRMNPDCDNCFFSLNGVCQRVGGCRFDN